MANQRFNTVFVLFTICSLFVGPVAMSNSSSTSSSTPTTYDTEINKGELGIRMRFNPSANPNVQVSIYYDTETQSAKDFFQKQLTAAAFQSFSACNTISWNLMPCGTSRLVNGVLVCPYGPEQCKFDVIHACVATLYQSDQSKIGQFIICFFQNKDVNACIANTGLVQSDVDQCVSSNQGANDCDAFFNKIYGKETHEVLNPPVGSASSDGTTNFKGVLCDLLANNQLSCDYCFTTGNNQSG